MPPTPSRLRRPRIRRCTRSTIRASRTRTASRGSPGSKVGLDWARRIELVSVLVASLVAVAGLWYSSVQTRQANDQAAQDRALVKEGQVIDRYTAAVDNLGDDKLDVRLGGIYALQRIMQDSTRDQPPIANVLATYVRTHANEPPAKGQEVPADVQAALIALTTRDTAHDKGFALDLRDVWLPKAEIGHQSINYRIWINSGSANADADRFCTFLDKEQRPGDLRVETAGITPSSAELSSAHLSSAHLAGADLFCADLSGADLGGADLSGADLRYADLRHADLRHADLRHADLTGANLKNVDLSGADLRNAVNVSRKQLSAAFIDEKTRWPAHLF